LQQLDVLTSESQETKWSICSLFSGCGGLDLGFAGDFWYKDNYYKDLGFNILAAYDFSSSAVQAYNQNLNPNAIMCDLSNLSKADLSRDTPKHDLLIGGFPCQEFSICGPRGGLDTERGRLYQVLAKVMEIHQPRVVVAENVLNLARMQEGNVLKKILSDFEDTGYNFKVWQLNGPEYGVPQNRKRIFLIGVRKNIEGFPEKPMPIYSENFPSIDWAIDDLINVVDESVPNQSQYFKASKAKKGGGQGDETSRSGLPAYTVRANPRSRVQFHHRLPRRLTVRECARIQTFPDNFIFPFSTTTNTQLIGNAVPPIMAHIIAESIAKFLKSLG